MRHPSRVLVARLGIDAGRGGDPDPVATAALVAHLQAAFRRDAHEQSRLLPAHSSQSSSSSAARPKQKATGSHRRRAVPVSPSSSDESSESDSEDDDDYEPDDEQLAQGLREISLTDSSSSSSSRSSKRDRDAELEDAFANPPFAKEYVRNVLKAAGPTRSVEHVFKNQHEFNVERNRFEAVVLARILDASLKKDLSLVMEIAARRLAGVEAADRGGNWKLCAAIELNNERSTYVPAKELSRALAQVARLASMEKSSSSDKPAGGSRPSGGSSRVRHGEQRRSRRNDNGDYVPSGTSESTGAGDRSQSRGAASARRRKSNAPAGSSRKK